MMDNDNNSAKWCIVSGINAPTRTIYALKELFYREKDDIHNCTEEWITQNTQRPSSRKVHVRLNINGVYDAVGHAISIHKTKADAEATLANPSCGKGQRVKITSTKILKTPIRFPTMTKNIRKKSAITSKSIQSVKNLKTKKKSTVKKKKVNSNQDGRETVNQMLDTLLNKNPNAVKEVPSRTITSGQYKNIDSAPKQRQQHPQLPAKVSTKSSIRPAKMIPTILANGESPGTSNQAKGGKSEKLPIISPMNKSSGVKRKNAFVEKTPTREKKVPPSLQHHETPKMHLMDKEKEKIPKVIDYEKNLSQDSSRSMSFETGKAPQIPEKQIRESESSEFLSAPLSPSVKDVQKELADLLERDFDEAPTAGDTYSKNHAMLTQENKTFQARFQRNPSEWNWSTDTGSTPLITTYQPYVGSRFGVDDDNIIVLTPRHSASIVDPPRILAEAAVRDGPKYYCRRTMNQSTDCLNSRVLDCSVTFKVDKNIRVIGVQVPTQIAYPPSLLPPPVYTEILYAHILDADGSRFTYTHFTTTASCNSLVEIGFNRPVYIQKNKIYRVGVVFNRAGKYPIGDCAKETSCDTVHFAFGGGRRDGLIRSIVFTYH